MCERIGELAEGTYSYAMTIDGYDEPVTLQAAVAINRDSISVDFSGTSPASPRGINVPLSYAQAYASFGVRCLVGNDVPNNAGSLGVISVTAPEGCLVNALPPRAVSARHSIGQMLPDVVLGCLHQVIEDAAPAEGASCIWNPVFMSTFADAGANEANTEFVINPIFNGGTGARPSKDGLSTTAFPSGVRTTSSEVNEVTSPLVVWHKEYLAGSGGRGRWRGGLGQRIEIGHREGAPFVVSKMFDRIQHPARGRDGGEAGAAGRVYVVDDSGDEQDLPGKGRDVVPAGARLVLETPGGGGMGNPENRDPEAVAIDQSAGLVGDN